MPLRTDMGKEVTGQEIGWERQPAPFGRRLSEVVRVEVYGQYHVFWIDDASGPAPAPGQFYMLASKLQWGGETGRPYLARALSVLRSSGSQRGFLIDTVGPGTERLSRLQPGEELWLMGPFGNGFVPPENKDIVLVGGGVGVAPLVILSDYLRSARISHSVCLGFRSSDYTAVQTLFDPITVAIATDDGSEGIHGKVTDRLVSQLAQNASTTVYSCGPPRMLAAVHALCSEYHVSGQLALEAPMACGFGSCYGCVVEQADGSYARACVDGPVFSTALLAEKTFAE